MSGRGKSAALGIAIASAVAFGYSNIFVNLPGSKFCGGSLTNVGLYLDSVIVLSVIAYLVYLRWKVKVLAVADDKRMWTTGDYAVLLRNLKDGLDADKPESERITADALRELVFADLAELGWALRGWLKGISAVREEMLLEGAAEAAEAAVNVAAVVSGPAKAMAMSIAMAAAPATGAPVPSQAGGDQATIEESSTGPTAPSDSTGRQAQMPIH